MDQVNEVSLDLIKQRAGRKDDRKEYAAKKKYGKTYKNFMDSAKDDREEYKNRMKYGKKVNEESKPFEDLTDRIDKQGSVGRGSSKGQVNKGSSNAMSDAIKQRSYERFKKPQEMMAKKSMLQKKRLKGG